MKLLSKLTAVFLSVITAVSAAFPAYADSSSDEDDVNPGGPVRVAEYADSYYTQASSPVMFAMDPDRKIRKIFGSDPYSKYDPSSYIKKISRLEPVEISNRADGNISEYYSVGNVLLAVWKCDISSFIDAESILKKYSGDMIYEAMTLERIGGYKISGGKKLYQDGSGKTVTGWQNFNGSKYYFNKDGSMAKGTLMIDGTRCKFGTDGVYKGTFTGWTKSSKGKRYWKNGKVVKNKRLTAGSKWYYADKNGYVTEGINIERKQIFDDDYEGFTSIAETVNIDGKCYSKAAVGLVPENDKDEKYLKQYDKNLSYSDIFNAKPIGNGCSGTSAAINDFRLGESVSATPSAMYRLDENRVVGTRTTEVKKQTHYDPETGTTSTVEPLDPETLEPIPEKKITAYYIFEYNEQLTNFAKAVKLIYGKRGKLGIDSLAIVDYYGKRTDVYSVYLEIKVPDQSAAKKVKDFLKKEKIDAKMIDVVVC